MLSLILKFKKVMIALLVGYMLSACPINSSFADVTVGIDSGHYMGEPGKRSPYDPVFNYQKAEIEYNMGMARLVKQKLKERRPDIKIYLTNPNATNQGRSQRAVEAKEHNVDYLISIHMNAIGDKWQNKINGCCVLVNKNATLQTKNMAKEFINEYSEGTGIKKVMGNGVHESGTEVGLLNKATELEIPSILLEMDFMDFYQSYRNFSDKDYLDHVADVITDCIIHSVDSLNN